MDNVRKNLSLDLFHEVPREELMEELKKLEEKHERYSKCINEHTVRIHARISKIKEFLKS